MGAVGAGRGEADLAQADHQVLPGGPDVRRADRVEGAVGDGPADQHGEQQGQRGGVAAEQFGDAAEDDHHPQGDPPARSARHADGRHIGDHRGEVAVHRIGQGADGVQREAGQRVPDVVGGALGHPPVDAQRDAVGQDRGEHAVGDPQSVAFDQPLDREGERHGQHRDVGDQAGDGGQHRGEAGRVLGDVDLDAGGGRGRHTGEHEHRDDAEDAGQEADEVRGAVRAGGEQRFVDIQVRGVVQRVVLGARGRVLCAVGHGTRCGFDRGRLAGYGGGCPGRGAGLLGALDRPFLDQGDYRGRRGGGMSAATCGHAVGGLVGALVHTHVSRPGHLVLSSYHHSPPRRWWHASAPRAGQGPDRARRIVRTGPAVRPDAEECRR